MTEIVVGEVLPSLAENEAVIERGMHSFVEVGTALTLIRDELQYVTAGFDSFEDYCRERWDLSSSAANKKIGASKVASHARARDLPMPASERAAMPLVKLMNEAGRYDPITKRLLDEQAGERAVVTAWREIIKRSETPTQRDVQAVLGSRANTHPPGWFELLGDMGDSLRLADKKLAKVETAVTRRAKEPFREKAAAYAEIAEGIAARLRELAA